MTTPEAPNCSPFPRWDDPQRPETAEEATLLRLLKRASVEHKILEPDDHVLVAMSGGKDSYALAYALWRVQRDLPFKIRLSFINIDMGFGGGFKQESIRDYLAFQGHELISVRENAGEVCAAKIPENESPCWLCARLRRGILYTRARALGVNKLALGHHADDLIETLFLNACFAGQLKGMPPKFLSDDRSVTVIRPFAYAWEDTIRTFAAQMGFPIIGCACGVACDLIPTRRKEAKRLIAALAASIPDVKQNLLVSMKSPRLGHLLIPPGRVKALSQELAAMAEDSEN